MNDLNSYLEEKSPGLLVRFDPAINRAVKFAFADNLIFQLKNGSFKLTDKGKELVREINADDNLMFQEKKILLKIGYRLSSNKIESLMSLWGYRNVED